jgi:Na+-transporting methylmalonyl-CoA/oxaloacetate decarboxylase gamma subunit
MKAKGKRETHMNRLAHAQNLQQRSLMRIGAATRARLALLGVLSVAGLGFLGLLTVLSLLTTAGCVTDAEYREAVHEAETARAQVEQAQAESSSLEQQLKALEAEVTSLTSRSQALAEELQQMKETQAQEQLAFDEAVGRMHHAVISLKSQNRTLQHDFDEQQKENIALASLVQRYSRELEEIQAANARPVAPVASAIPAVAQMPAQGVQPNGHAAMTQTPPVAKPSPSKPTVPSPAPTSDDGWLAAITRWLMAIWHLVF